MKKPELTDKHRRFESLSGEWIGTETLHQTPMTPAGKAEGRFSFHTILQGFFLTADWLEQSEGKTLMQGHAVIGWDEARNEYTMHWFDNFGSPPHAPGRGRWEGNALTFQHELPTHQGRETFSLSEGKLTFKVEMTFAGKWTTVVEGDYRRASASPASEQRRDQNRQPHPGEGRG
jgi:hypothetical protein